MSAARILVVDDDAITRELLRSMLERAGHEVREASDGRAGLRELYATMPDLVILDVDMPELDGWAMLERVRDLSDVPVLMLTAHETELERVRGLRGGADDYVPKPVGHQELVARVDALLRRARGRTAAARETYADARVLIDFAQRAVRCDERDVQLTPLEFRLLATFVRHPNQVLSREQLLELVWGGDRGGSPEQVKVYVGYLRRKLDPASPKPRRSRRCGALATAIESRADLRRAPARLPICWQPEAEVPTPSRSCFRMACPRRRTASRL